MKNIIYEYEEVGCKKLVEHIVDSPKLHKYFKLEWKTLKAKQYCGILNFDNQDFYILPKIANHNDEQNLNIFMYMLMYAYDVKLFNESTSLSKNLKTHNISIPLYTTKKHQNITQNIFKQTIISY